MTFHNFSICLMKSLASFYFHYLITLPPRAVDFTRDQGKSKNEVTFYDVSYYRIILSLRTVNTSTITTNFSIHSSRLLNEKRSTCSRLRATSREHGAGQRGISGKAISRTVNLIFKSRLVEYSSEGNYNSVNS